MSCLWQKVWENALVKLGLSYHTALEEFLAFYVERSMEDGKECSRVFAQDLACLATQRAKDIDALQGVIDVRHGKS